jgi:hypothetical protein
MKLPRIAGYLTELLALLSDLVFNRTFKFASSWPAASIILLEAAGQSSKEPPVLQKLRRIAAITTLEGHKIKQKTISRSLQEIMLLGTTLVHRHPVDHPQLPSIFTISKLKKGRKNLQKAFLWAMASSNLIPMLTINLRVQTCNQFLALAPWTTTRSASPSAKVHTQSSTSAI